MFTLFQVFSKVIPPIADLRYGGRDNTSPSTFKNREQRFHASIEMVRDCERSALLGLLTFNDDFVMFDCNTSIALEGQCTCLLNFF